MDIKEVITNFVISINELGIDKKELIDEIRQTEEYKNTSPKVKTIFVGTVAGAFFIITCKNLTFIYYICICICHRQF